MVLMPQPARRLGDAFELARLLVRAGVPVRTAKKAIDDLAAGRTAYVEAPAKPAEAVVVEAAVRLLGGAFRVVVPPAAAVTR